MGLHLQASLKITRLLFKRNEHGVEMKIKQKASRREALRAGQWKLPPSVTCDNLLWCLPTFRRSSSPSSGQKMRYVSPPTSTNTHHTLWRHIRRHLALLYMEQCNSHPLYHTHPKSITCAHPHPIFRHFSQAQPASYLPGPTHPIASLRSIHIQPLLNLAPITMYVYAPSGTHHPGAIYPCSSTSCDQEWDQSVPGYRVL
jgi:hypothetical protein